MNVSDKNLADIVRTAAPPADLDLDDLYQRRIKGLHGAIVNFSSQAEADMTPDQVEVLNATKTVARDLVRAVKDVKHLHKNLQKYVNSPNEDISAQYGAARLLIATILRDTRSIRRDRAAAIQTFEQLEASIDQHDIVATGELDHLIRDGCITPEMATSLINDTGYTMNISHRLIDAALTVLGERTQMYLQAVEGSADSVEADEKAISGVEARAVSDS